MWVTLGAFVSIRYVHNHMHLFVKNALTLLYVECIPLRELLFLVSALSPGFAIAMNFILQL